MRSMSLVMSFIFLSLSLSPLLQCQEPATGDKSATSAQVPAFPLDERYRNAMELEQEGLVDQALNEYLWIFDNSRDSGGFAGVRLSFLLGSIAKIGKQNPAALQALRDRRAVNEGRILEGKFTFDDVMEFRAISKYLEDEAASQALYETLKAKGPETTKARQKLMDLIWQDFVREQQYSELNEFIMNIARSLARIIDHARLEKDFPRNNAPASQNRYLDFEKSDALKKGSLAFEAALALKRPDVADPLIQRLLEFRSDGAMYSALIQAALNAGDKAKARELYGKAKASLPKAERSALSNFKSKLKD